MKGAWALAAVVSAVACGSSVGVGGNGGAASEPTPSGSGGSDTGGGAPGGGDGDAHDREALWRDICACFNPLSQAFAECMARDHGTEACSFATRSTESLAAEVDCGCGNSSCVDEWLATQSGSESYLAMHEACLALPCQLQFDCTSWPPGVYRDEVYAAIAECLATAPCVDAQVCFACDQFY